MLDLSVVNRSISVDFLLSRLLALQHRPVGAGTRWLLLDQGPDHNLTVNPSPPLLSGSHRHSPLRLAEPSQNNGQPEWLDSGTHHDPLDNSENSAVAVAVVVAAAAYIVAGPSRGGARGEAAGEGKQRATGSG